MRGHQRGGHTSRRKIEPSTPVKQPSPGAPAEPAAVDDAARQLTAPGGIAAAAAAPQDARAGAARRPRVTVEVVHGDITQVKSPVSVVGRYQGLPARGSAQQFDRRMDSWLSRAIECGMIGSDLGQLFYVPLDHKRVASSVAPDALIVAGLGEPGRFSRDSLRFLMTNVTLAVKALGHDEMNAPLLGFSRGELPLESVVRGMLEGVADGLDRFPDGDPWGIRLKVVHLEGGVAAKILDTLKVFAGDATLADLLLLEVLPERLELPRRESLPVEQSPADVRPPEPSTRITITCAVGADGGATQPTDSPLVFQYAALGETAVIPVRDQEVHQYFASRLPGRLTAAPEAATAEACRRPQDNFGKLLARYLIPDDIQRLIEGGDPLTLVLDSTTACYPWEMAGFKGHRDTYFFGTNLQVARQFRTPLSAVPGIAPPLNNELKILLIADPAPGDYRLQGARQEGLAVVGVLKSLQDAWGKIVKLDVTVRLGSVAEQGAPELREQLEKVRDLGPVIRSAEPCDPLELLALLVNEAYDVVHYAGHGIFDAERRRMGWVFDEDCTLSAAEIFRVRQVPRLVFANACLSAVTADLAHQQRQQVGLAEAFFGRGIENYIGTGWSRAG
jgi:hypothetical protein